MQTSQKVICIVTKFIVLACIAGCLPSPNAPLGSQSESKPKSTTEPVFRPAITKGPEDSANPQVPNEKVANTSGSESASVSSEAENQFLDDLVPKAHEKDDTEVASQPSPSDPNRMSATTSPLPASLPSTNLTQPDETYLPPVSADQVTAIPETHEAKPIPDLPNSDTDFGFGNTHRPDPGIMNIGQNNLSLAPAERNTPSLSGSTPKSNVPLIPREAFFGNPQRMHPRVSPDGKRIAYLAEQNGVMNVFVAPIDRLNEATVVTQEIDRGLDDFHWAFTSRHILYLQDASGTGDYHVFAVNLDTDEIRDLTPIENISARVIGVSQKFPAEILVGVNDRPPHELHDIHKVNIVTGAHELVLENPGFADFLVDDDYRIRFGQSYLSNGGVEYVAADPQSESGWSEFLEIGPEDALSTSLTSFDKTGRRVYALDSRGRNTTALKLLDLGTGKETVIAESQAADISRMIVHPTEKTIQAVTFNYDRRKWKIIDESIDSDLEYLHSIADGAEIQIASRTLDDRLWTVTAERDNGAEQYFLYDRDAHRATKLFSSNEPLDRLPLVNMHTAVIRSRDGWPLVSYLSLPAGTDRNGDGRPETPLPMVLSVHGGPWARDAWGYNPLHQLLANRGYAVLSVNYRGSTGFGKQFTNAANGEWAGKMHEDLLDAVRWATAEKIADRQRIAIMGGSFGGYATLVGMTFSPDIFACGIDISGPSNLATLLENPPPYWMPLMPVLRQRVGDHRTEQGQADLASRSPLRFADRIKRPMLIAQGAEDPRVRRAETDQIVDAMRRQQIPVTYLLYPNEGHGLQKQSNRFAFYAAAEAFLAEHLGGRYQPPGNVYRDADIQVLAGREYIRGMQ